tara:strand:- start:282 stop:671 length:390 start_codon:yes stop_codon:yes gene_type:complete
MPECCDDTPPPLLLKGVAQFNRGEFFEQHETLEDLWRNERREIRYLYQGILQIGVAMYHISQCNHHGAVYMLTRGQNYLQPFTPSCQTIDVDDLLNQANQALHEVQQLGPKKLKRFNRNLVPKVRFVTP